MALELRVSSTKSAVDFGVTFDLRVNDDGRMARSDDAGFVAFRVCTGGTLLVQRSRHLHVVTRPLLP